MRKPASNYAAAERRATGPVVRRPRAVGEVLSGFLENRGLLRGMEDHRLLLGWKEIVGPSLAHDTRPVRIERGTVWIGVSNAPQANHLLYLRPWILKRIKECYPNVLVREIRIQHRPAEGRGAR